MSLALTRAEVDAAVTTARAAGLGGLAERRAAEAARFAHLGVPNRRNEAWRWTDIAKALANCQAVPAQVIEPLDLGLERVVVRDGVVETAAYNLASALARGDAGLAEIYARPVASADGLGALNAAAAEDGVVARLNGGTRLHLDLIATGAKAQARTRSLIQVAAGADVVLIETHRGADSAHLSHHGFDIALEAGAKLTHLRVEVEGPSALHVIDSRITLAKDARYDAVALSLGAKMSRSDTAVILADEGADARLVTIYLADGARHVDTTSLIEHRVPHGTSEQIVRGVAAGRGRGVFQGKILVHPHAQKTDARQSTKALILNEGAEADHKPELEIHADDVVCAHGATCGDIDAGALFYLRARGIPKAQARMMLVKAFLAEELGALGDHDFAVQALDHALAQLEGAQA